MYKMQSHAQSNCKKYIKTEDGPFCYAQRRLDLRNVYLDDDHYCNKDAIVNQFAQAQTTDYTPMFYFENNLVYYARPGVVYSPTKGFLPSETGQQNYLIHKYKKLKFARGLYGLVESSRFINVYFHFVKVVTAAIAIHDRYPGATIILPEYLTSRFQLEYIDMLQDKMSIEFCSSPYGVVCETGIYSNISFNNFPPVETYQLFGKYFPSSQVGCLPERIYITRNKSRSRYIVNDSEVQSLLQSYGFVSVDFDILSVREQIDILRAAKFVIAPHGSGLTNLVYADDGIRLVECFDKDYLSACFIGDVLNKNIRYQALVSTKSVSQCLASSIDLEKLEIIINSEPYDNFSCSKLEEDLCVTLDQGISCAMQSLLASPMFSADTCLSLMECHEYRRVLSTLLKMDCVNLPSTNYNDRLNRFAAHCCEKMYNFDEALSIIDRRMKNVTDFNRDSFCNLYSSLLRKKYAFVEAECFINAHCEKKSSRPMWTYLENAHLYENIGSIYLSIRCVHEALTEDPEKEEYRIQLLTLLRKKWSFDEVMAYIEKYMGDNLDRAKGYFQLAYLYEAKEEIDQAVDMALKYVQVKPYELVAQAYLCSLVRKKWELDYAESIAKAGLEVDSGWAAGYKELSLICETKGDFETAIDYARRAVDSAHYDLSYRHHLSALLRKTTDYNEADNVVRAGLEINEFWVEGYIQLSHSKEAQGDFESAIEYVRQAIAIDQYSLPFRARLAQLLRNKGSFSESVEAIRIGLELNPYWNEGNRQLSYCYDAQGKLNAAIEAALKPIAIEPHTLWFREHPANLLCKKGDFEGATALIQAGLDINPYWSSGYKQLSIVADKKGEKAEALSYAQKTVEISPYTLWHYAHFANLLRKYGEYDEAKAVAVKALALNPYWGEGHRLLSYVHDAQGQLDDAIGTALKSVTVEPYTLVFREHPANLLCKKGDFKGATALIQDGLDIDSCWSSGYKQLSIVADKKGEKVEALSYAQKAVEISPYTLWHYAHLANLLRKYEKYNEAKAVAVKALALNPYWGEGHSLLSHVHDVQGQLDEAIEAALNSVTVEPYNHWRREYAVRLLRKKGDIEGAVALIQSGLEVNPRWNFGHKQLSVISARKEEIHPVTEG